MSTATWLHGQRKSELITLAEKVGLEDYESLKKPELEAALEEHMRENQTSLSKDSSLATFFKRLDAPHSPVKRESGPVVVVSDEVKKPSTRNRRTTRGKSEIETEQSSPSGSESPPPPPPPTNALAARTPRRPLPSARNVPLPPSPAVIAEKIDEQAAALRSSIATRIRATGIVDATEELRDKLSQTVSIESIALLVEIYGLQGDVLPVKYLTLVPAMRSLGTPALPVKLPDAFAMLEWDFWTTLTLWLATSVVLPLVSAYFFNLGLKAKHGRIRGAKAVACEAQFDALSFNVAKALVTWLVYAKGIRFGGLFGERAVGRIEANLPGGYSGVLVGTGIGALTSVYEAILKR